MRKKDASTRRPVSGPSLRVLPSRLWTCFVLAAALLALTARREAAEVPTRDPEAARLPWSFLSLQGERLGSRVAADVRIETLRAAVEQARFLPSPRGKPVGLSGPDMLKLSLRIRTDIIGRKSIRLDSETWFNPRTGLPLYLVRTRSGLSDYYQQFRFTQEGVFRRQREPDSAAETAQPPESWSKVGEHFYAYPRDEAFAHPVSETLIYLLAAGAVPPEQGMEPLVVFHKRQLHRVSLRVVRKEAIPFDFLAMEHDADRRHSGAMPARMIRIESRPIGSYRGDVEDFVNDDTIVYLSLDGRLPLMVRCELPLLGRLELKLKEIRFN